MGHDMSQPIKIVYYSEVMDNWGRTESTFKPETIHKILNTPDDFTDDMTFEDEHEQRYTIDELIGKEVLVEGYPVFIVPDDDDL